MSSGNINVFMQRSAELVIQRLGVPESYVGGKSNKVIPPLHKGDLTKYGYHTDKDKSDRRVALIDALEHGMTNDELIHKLNALYVLNKNNKNGKIFKSDRKYISRLNKVKDDFVKINMMK